MGKYLLGKEVEERILIWANMEINALKEKDIIPSLALVRVGENPDDIAYESSIIKKMEGVGILTRVFCLKDDISEEYLLNHIEKLNNHHDIDGILVFFPLPKHINEENVKNKIAPNKDVDGANPINFTKLCFNKKDGFAPCTAQAVIEMLEYNKIQISGKNVVVVGRSFIVGKPVAMLLLNLNATVTICHSKTEDLRKICKGADVLVLAVGKGRMIDETYVNKHQTIIDCGINFINGEMCGDCDTAKVLFNCQAISPVPKGLGVVTTAVLIKNLIKATKLNR